MQVGVDHGPERLGAFDPRIEIEPELARERQVRPLTGGDHYPVDGRERPPAVRRLAFEDDLLAGPAYCGAREPEHQGRASAVD
jgi:hypothetical protein